MNKRALLGLIIIIAIIIFLLVAGILVFKFSKSGFKVSTGNLVLSLDYNKTQNSTNVSSIPEEQQKIRIIEENISLENNTAEYKNLSN